MYQRKESAKNTYYPSFLCMEVDTPDYLDALMRIPFDEHLMMFWHIEPNVRHSSWI